MADSNMPVGSPTRLLFGFVAGFLATLIFHQLTLALLWAVGIAPFGPFPMAATEPFGVPVLFSLAFWAGVWGILFALVDRNFPRGGGYWLTAFLFGAILPSLVALLVVLPLKGKPMGGGWNPSLLLTAFLINGAWGIGTGLFLKWLPAWVGGSRSAAIGD
ncbi:MAG: hypothetical protein ACR2RB_02410 [Gammaproteobacteria bacterium]